MGISKKKREFLIEWSEFYCEECKKNFESFSDFEIHKINTELGYHWRNCKVVCKNRCHKIFSSAQRKANGIQ